MLGGLLFSIGVFVLLVMTMSDSARYLIEKDPPSIVVGLIHLVLEFVYTGCLAIVVGKSFLSSRLFRPEWHSR